VILISITLSNSTSFSINIDSLLSVVKPSTKRIGYSSRRALDGTLWTDFTIIKKFFTLEFDLLSSTDRDSLLTLFTSTSNGTITFTGYNTTSSSYLTQITNDTISEEEIFDTDFTPYYNISFTLEEQ